jgi:hypothetical protein
LEVCFLETARGIQVLERFELARVIRWSLHAKLLQRVFTLDAIRTEEILEILDGLESANVVATDLEKNRNSLSKPLV